MFGFFWDMVLNMIGMIRQGDLHMIPILIWAVLGSPITIPFIFILDHFGRWGM